MITGNAFKSTLMNLGCVLLQNMIITLTILRIKVKFRKKVRGQRRIYNSVKQIWLSVLT